MKNKRLVISIVEITSFKTSDGKVFENQQEARKHAAEQLFRAWCRGQFDGRENWSDNIADTIWEEFGEVLAESIEDEGIKV